MLEALSKATTSGMERSTDIAVRSIVSGRMGRHGDAPLRSEHLQHEIGRRIGISHGSEGGKFLPEVLSGRERDRQLRWAGDFPLRPFAGFGTILELDIRKFHDQVIAKLPIERFSTYAGLKLFVPLPHIVFTPLAYYNVIHQSVGKGLDDSRRAVLG